MNDIFIFATGGTIDKIHDPVTEELVFDGKTRIPEILKQCRSEQIPHEVLMLKDSLHMGENDRETIKKAVLARHEHSIIISHGTGTMEKTASYLKDHMEDKTVVLTGAMRPFSLFNSDASFNLGSAITAAQLCPPGVYIAMNGQIFKAGNVTKDRETGFFKEL